MGVGKDATAPTRPGCPHTQGQRWLEEQDSASLKGAREWVSKCLLISRGEAELSVTPAARRALGKQRDKPQQCRQGLEKNRS